MGSCVFKAGYCLYADTCIGRCIHNRYITSFQRQFGEDAMHSKLTPFVFNDLVILPIPVLVNNYAYLVADVSEHATILVDVGDATIVKKMNVTPDAVLTTHKHWDHSGGNRLMRAAFPSLRVYGGALDHVPDSTHSVTHGQELLFGNLKFTAMWTPGHTKGHIVWHLDGSHFGCPDSVFTGDLIMLAGCGAVFEGSIRQMFASLNMIKELPNETMVWPGHELAIENLDIAVFVEPDNVPAVLKLVWAVNQRELRQCTCPSTIGDEKQYNPFLRLTECQLLTSLGIIERTRCPNHPMSEEEIAELCFDVIVTRASQLRQARKAFARKLAIEEEGRRQTEQSQQLTVTQIGSQQQQQQEEQPQEQRQPQQSITTFRPRMIPAIIVEPPSSAVDVQSR